jgi:hypothetical protein
MLSKMANSRSSRCLGSAMVDCTVSISHPSICLVVDHLASP